MVEFCINIHAGWTKDSGEYEIIKTNIINNEDGEDVMDIQHNSDGDEEEESDDDEDNT